MLTINGSFHQKYCDSVSRRDFLKVGAMGIGGLTLADVFRADALAGPAAKKKSFINVYLSGGPSHLDMWDLKPDAPSEIRGEFYPINTNVPGAQISYLMPRLATMMDRMAIIRSLTGVRDEHAPNQPETGFPENSLTSVGGRPSLGSVISKLHGPTNGSVPTFVSFSDQAKTGFLGPVYAPFRPDGQGRANLTLSSVSADRFTSRNQLLGQLDRVRRDMDGSHMMEAMDSFNQRAVGVITSSKLAQALSIEKEDPKVKKLYGLDSQMGRGGDRFLVARRLVEQGVRAVSLSFGGWDTHSDNFTSLKRQLPELDNALGGLIQDLTDRGMLDDVVIAVWGEFGRTPRINPMAGRDHWSRGSSVVLAGGGLKLGQVIGSTNRYGEEPKDRPVHLQEVFATLYNVMGVDAAQTAINDPNGRPQYLVENYRPIRELV